MRCAATAKSTGQRCRRTARAGGDRCRFHEGEERLRPEDEEATGSADSAHGILGETPAAGQRGMDGEIVLLRRRIREAAAEEDWESMRRGIETLCKVYKVQHVLEGRSTESLATSLSRVLEEVGNELGMTL